MSPLEKLNTVRNNIPVTTRYHTRASGYDTSLCSSNTHNKPYRRITYKPLPFIPILFLLTFSLLLTSCGLQAVYSDKYTHLTDNPLNAIEIAEVESIEGTEFYQHLSNLMPKTHTAKYLLKVQFSNASIPGAFQKNSDIIRAIINQDVKYQLFDLSTNKMLTSGHFKQVTSYNTIFAPYPAYIESEKASEDLTKNAAEEVFRRLTLYFK